MVRLKRWQRLRELSTVLLPRRLGAVAIEEEPEKPQEDGLCLVFGGCGSEPEKGPMGGWNDRRNTSIVGLPSDEGG